MTDVTGAARDELDLPAAALELVVEGRRQLEERRAAEQAARERKDAEERDRRAALLEPLRAVVAGLVPAGLLEYVDWRPDDLIRAGHNHEVTLAVPGCAPVQIPLEVGATAPWHLWEGYYVRGQAYPTLPMALAAARAAVLDEDDYPF